MFVKVGKFRVVEEFLENVCKSGEISRS